MEKNKQDIIKSFENKLNNTTDEGIKKAIKLKLKSLKGDKTITK